MYFSILFVSVSGEHMRERGAVASVGNNSEGGHVPELVTVLITPPKSMEFVLTVSYIIIHCLILLYLAIPNKCITPCLSLHIL